eukprot:scaffold27461_cov37-Prasinocladus_malaysianus.AAC.2
MTATLLNCCSIHGLRRTCAQAHGQQPLDENPAARAVRIAAADPTIASHLKIVVRGCRGLKPSVPPAESLPYVGYTFPGAERTHFTPFDKGVHPVFNDEMILPIGQCLKEMLGELPNEAKLCQRRGCDHHQT